jgi:hypothetical protein
LAVVVVGLAAGAGAAVVELTGAGAVVSGAGAVSGVALSGVAAGAVTAPPLAAGFGAAEFDPELHAAPARVRASRPATRPVRNGRFTVVPPADL